MKEIIKHINGVAGRVVTITGLTETTMTRDNVLGILNGTQNEVLYVPMFYGDLSGVTYSNGTLTITLASSVPAIAAGDKLFVKLYTDEDSGGGGGGGIEIMTDAEYAPALSDLNDMLDAAGDDESESASE